MATVWILSLYHHHYFVRIVNWYCISFKEKNEKCPYVLWVRLHVHGIVYKVVLRNMNLTFYFYVPIKIFPLYRQDSMKQK